MYVALKITIWCRDADNRRVTHTGFIWGHYFVFYSLVTFRRGQALSKWYFVLLLTQWGSPWHVEWDHWPLPYEKSCSRKEIFTLNAILRDSPQGTTWSNPSLLDNWLVATTEKSMYSMSITAVQQYGGLQLIIRILSGLMSAKFYFINGLKVHSCSLFWKIIYYYNHP